ncbi:luciferase family protein [Streptomyces sp. NPDC019531]|uniref:luciferase domain-containing protein n=1 Tax=Streptomyces sp. NPDC019531 TaxID=3365062 RepID=UPI00384F0AC9
MTLAERALERLEAWSDLSAGMPSCGAGLALCSAHSEIVHFHPGRDVDLHLTESAIRRFHDDLQDSTAVRLVPGSRWVTVHLDCETDVDLLMSLVSMALNAHQAGHRPVGEAECNFHRVTVVPRDSPFAPIRR